MKNYTSGSDSRICPMTDTKTKTLAPTPDAYLEKFSRFETQPSQPKWLLPIRKAGFARVGELGFPTLHHEDWRFTNVAPVVKLPFKPALDPVDEISADRLNDFAFAKLPGSWWNDSALIRARALLDQQKSAEAERAARELMSGSTDSETVAAGQLLMARLKVSLDKADIADAMLDEIMRKEVSSEIGARAAILRGDIAFKRKDFEKALEFYLQVPAFYGTEDAVMPVALLGSARSYRGYGDTPRAERAYLDITVTYPTSAEAVIAKRESADL